MKLIPRSFPWYYVTRALGAVAFVYAVFFDETGERGTLILTAAGLLGLEKVARTDAPPKAG